MTCPSCSCSYRPPCRPIDLIRGPVFEPLVVAPQVVEIEVGGKLPAGLGNALISYQVHLLVLDAPPEPFDEDVVHPAAPSVHADPDAVGREQACESLRSELRALVGVEDVRGSVASQGFFERLDAEGGVEGVGESPAEHAPAGPVHDRRKTAEAPRHGQVGDVRAPDLPGVGDVHPPQQVRVDRVVRMRLGEPALGIERLYPHLAHEGGHVPSAHVKAAVKQLSPYPSDVVEWELQVDLVHGGHQGQITLSGSDRLVVDACAGEVEKTRLPADRHGMGPVDHRFALVPPMRPSAPDKKSFSMVSSPILACNSAMLAPLCLACSSSPKTAAAPSKSWRFHLVIWLGWTSKRSAITM